MKSIPLFFCLLASVLLSGCYQPAPQQQEKSMEEIVLAFNKTCPRRIDSETRMDGIELKNNNTVAYNYTLINVLAQNVDTAEFRRTLWPGILSLIRVSPDLKSLRDKNTHFEYRYQDKKNKLIYTFKIYPTDYNSN